MAPRGFPRQDLIGFFWPPPSLSRRYEDRADAGRRLAQALERYRRDRPLVLGIPRGGVVVALEVARHLDADFDVLVAKKIGTPGHEELALGALTPEGTVYLNTDLVAALGVPHDAVAAAVAGARAAAEERDRRLHRTSPPVALAGRTVILVDDGLATGATMTAAAKAARACGAARVVIAVPVGAPDSCRELYDLCDDLVCLEQPELFFAVGAHYRVFDAVSDDEVDRLLAAERSRRAGEMRPAAG